MSVGSQKFETAGVGGPNRKSLSPLICDFGKRRHTTRRTSINGYSRNSFQMNKKGKSKDYIRLTNDEAMASLVKLAFGPPLCSCNSFAVVKVLLDLLKPNELEPEVCDRGQRLRQRATQTCR